MMQRDRENGDKKESREINDNNIDYGGNTVHRNANKDNNDDNDNNHKYTYQ